jgi:type I restriction-modification system DNA methylase subunit
MIFRGDGKNNIINGDCLSINLNRKLRNGEISAEYQTDPGERKPVNKVLMNPPFALKRDDEQEFTFINHALEQMVDEGLLLCVVPVSVMYASSRELEWRKRLLERNTLLAVVGFPNDLFYPQASVEPVIVVLRKGIPHQNGGKCLFARIVDDGFIKLKKRRLPHSGSNQLTDLRDSIATFIQGGVIMEIDGLIQTKPIDLTDPHLELIPQQHLDNAALDTSLLKRTLSTLQSELVFQEIRRGLSQ